MFKQSIDDNLPWIESARLWHNLEIQSATKIIANQHVEGSNPSLSVMDR